jgi:hypothetical protein
VEGTTLSVPDPGRGDRTISREWRVTAGISRARPQITVETGLSGWGASTRTWEWRNQNPLPYHLATPQQAALADHRRLKPPFQVAARP